MALPPFRGITALARAVAKGVASAPNNGVGDMRPTQSAQSAQSAQAAGDMRPSAGYQYQQRPPIDLDELADFLRLLSQQPAVQAEVVICTMADAAGAGQTIADVEHGLGRAYADGWIGAQSENVGLRLIDSVTAEAAGVDVARYARVVADASTTAVFSLWIL